ncbi:MAG: trimethylamine methyltransferase family protein [Planctomycetaceae bacterium]|nr:trimethylamine methyltransferase family protein [Planctomycetaceae bacterium]
MDFINLSELNVERIWADAVRLMDRVGFSVPNPSTLKKLQGKLPLRGGRVCVPPQTAQHYADEVRTRFGSKPEELVVKPVDKLSLFNSYLNTHWVDPADGQIKLHSTADVIRHTKLVLALAEEGTIAPNTAGVPQDVPPEMRFIMAHYLRCLYLRQPGPFGLIHSEAMMRYFIEMDAVMGFRPAVGTEIISPLQFAGDSVDLALEYHDKGVQVSCVDPIPIMGVTAPSDWHMAWAQTLAENIGAYTIFRECGVEKMGPPSIRLFTPNWAASTVSFSGPQHVLALMTRRKVREFFNMPTPWGELLLVSSKAPDAQAAIEKTAGCILARVFGLWGVEGAGGLWMDEIFSPQQLIIDIEAKHFAEGVRADVSPREGDVVAVVEEGLRSGGFLQADMTLENFRDFVWNAAVSDQRPRGSWTGDHTTLLKKATAIAADKPSQYTYEMTDTRREGLDRIIAKARKEFGA